MQEQQASVGGDGVLLGELLAILRPAIAGVREQLVGATYQLRHEGATPLLEDSLETLQRCFDLLHLVNAQVNSSSASLASFVTTISEALAILEAVLEAEPDGSFLATVIEARLLPGLDNWDDCERDVALVCATHMEAVTALRH